MATAIADSTAGTKAQQDPSKKGTVPQSTNQRKQHSQDA